MDFLKMVYGFSDCELCMGFFSVSDKHVEFILLHGKVKIRLKILVCFHDPEKIRLNFNLMIDTDVVYEKNVEDEKDMAMAVDEVRVLVSGFLKGLEDDGGAADDSGGV